MRRLVFMLTRSPGYLTCMLKLEKHWSRTVSTLAKGTKLYSQTQNPHDLICTGTPLSFGTSISPLACTLLLTTSWRWLSWRWRQIWLHTHVCLLWREGFILSRSKIQLWMMLVDVQQMVLIKQWGGGRRGSNRRKANAFVQPQVLVINEDILGLLQVGHTC